MRDIKFRFWSKLLGHIVVPDDSTFIGALKDPHMAVMQYTGHRDIDDKEVFEGDLLRFPTDSDQHYLVKWLEETGQWGIMFGPAVFNLQMGTIGLTQFMQVAGNIYENKELLDAKITNQT